MSSINNFVETAYIIVKYLAKIPVSNNTESRFALIAFC